MIKSNVFVFSSNKLGLAFLLFAIPLILILIPVVLLIGITITTLKIFGGFKNKSIHSDRFEKPMLKDLN